MDINYVEKDVIDQQHLKKYRTAMHHVNCQSTWYSMSWLGQINPCVCSATQMQLWHYGKEWSCRSCKIWQLHTCIQLENATPKVQTCTWHLQTLPWKTCWNTVCQAPSSLPLPAGAFPSFVVGRCSCAGTSEGIKAIKPLRKASTFSDDMGHWLHQIWSVGKESS